MTNSNDRIVHDRESYIATGCAGKEKFSQKQAFAVANRKRRGEYKMVAYRCAICSRWHVGQARHELASTPKRVKIATSMKRRRA